MRFFDAFSGVPMDVIEVILCLPEAKKKEPQFGSDYI